MIPALDPDPYFQPLCDSGTGFGSSKMCNRNTSSLQYSLSDIVFIRTLLSAMKFKLYSHTFSVRRLQLHCSHHTTAPSSVHAIRDEWAIRC